jgi:hypothetical protein
MAQRTTGIADGTRIRHSAHWLRTGGFVAAPSALRDLQRREDLAKGEDPLGDIIVGLTATGDHLYALFENCKKSNNGCVSFQVAIPVNPNTCSGVSVHLSE